MTNNITSTMRKMRYCFYLYVGRKLRFAHDYGANSELISYNGL